MPNYVLFHTDGCHLCEDALALIQQCLPSEHVFLIDIVETEQYMAQYETRIPVLKRQDTERELGWPFNLEQLQEFIK
ncbi:glutaredoxin family protein [Pseudoalteromonas sp. T1lg65]|uniref:glutaredoxin family protein n=1 Tax=Pseudoalteromonas sp. T1lg65 TaxID=2077101 RepID=UPI003F78D762